MKPPSFRPLHSPAPWSVCKAQIHGGHSIPRSSRQSIITRFCTPSCWYMWDTAKKWQVYYATPICCGWSEQKTYDTTHWASAKGCESIRTLYRTKHCRGNPTIKTNIMRVCTYIYIYIIYMYIYTCVCCVCVCVCAQLLLSLSLSLVCLSLSLWSSILLLLSLVVSLF